MENTTIFDDTLFSILKECHTLPNFLNSIFGFLKRRTDFYCITPELNSSIGFPEGWAECFVRQAFLKWKPDNNIHEKLEANCVPKPEKPVFDNKLKQINNNFSTSESYNGAVYDNYTWSQTISDVNVLVRLPKDASSKDLYVLIQSQKILVKLKKSNSILLEGELYQKIKHNDAIWSLDNCKLDIHLDKASEMWWNCLVTSEPKLDISNIDCSRPFEELSEEAQAQIEELTWNHERKRLGLPSSNQLNLQSKLSKALEAEGSPFRGIDPNTMIIN